MAIRRFLKFSKNIILITGGTDKNLNFKDLAKEIKQYLKPKNLILFNGSGTKKLIDELEKLNYKVLNIFEHLKDCIKKVFQIIDTRHRYIILFSPGAASFEKFKNEFDRGNKFNKMIKNILKFN